MKARMQAPARGHKGIETVGRQLAGTVLALRAAIGQLAELSLDAAASATMLGLLEQAHRSVAFGQLLATFQADASQVHRLDPEAAFRIDELAANPQALADGTVGVPPEILRQGMAAARNTQGYLQSHLHISAAESRRRLSGARLLVAPAPPNPADPMAGSGTAEPSFPVLAQAAADGSADVATLAQLAGRLNAMGPRITPRPDAKEVATAIEESLVHEARTGEPLACNKALQDWTSFLAENGSPITDAEILSRRGMFYRGFRDGCDEFLLRCDPIDSEVIRSFGEAWSNPRSHKSPPYSASTTPPNPHAPPGNPPGGSPSDGKPPGGNQPTNRLPGHKPPTSERPANRPVAQTPESQGRAEHGFTPPLLADPNPSGIVGPTTGAGPNRSADPDGIPGRTGAPLGTPIPEWAIAPGTRAGQVPVNQLECGPPDSGTANHGSDASPADPASGAAGAVSPPITPPPANPQRTTPQLLLDALVGACSGVLEGRGLGQSGGLGVRVGVTIDYRSLLGQLEEAGLTDHGRPVSALKIRAMACSGSLLPVVLGSAGEILDMGREVRSFTTAQRKAIAIRDRGCVVPGCDRPASTNEAHHVLSWLDGGPTSVDNAASLCSHHHLMVHAGLVTLRMIDAIPYVVARAGQPRSEPERNLIWHPELRTTGYAAPLFGD